MSLSIFKNRRGSEVIQNLIVIAIMGALAVTAIGAIARSIEARNNQVLAAIETNLNTAFQDAQTPGP